MKKFKLLEMQFLFIGIPLFLLIEVVPIYIKISTVFILFAACLLCLKKNDGFEFSFPFKKYARQVLKLFVPFVVGTTLFIYFYRPELFFIVPRKNLIVWLGICFGYSVFSVYPQELIYRTFFYARYKELFSNERLMIVMNAFYFGFCHIIFKNELVLVLTFLGGIIFSLRYLKSNSTLLISFEHALYGVWLFTIGMGQMLAFPMPN